MGETWDAKDTPILLHTFEYSVRNALIAWWAHFLVRGSRLRLFLQPLQLDFIHFKRAGNPDETSPLDLVT
jgi:hypothetical protein